MSLAVKRSFDEWLEPSFEGLMHRYGLLVPTSGTDGVDQQRDNSAKPFLAKQVGDNATSRAVDRALSKP